MARALDFRFRQFARTAPALVCNTDLCEPPNARLDIAASPSAIALPWIAFSNGSPSPAVDPSEVVQLRWDFEWVDGMTPYTVDVTLDNVVLIK